MAEMLSEIFKSAFDTDKYVVPREQHHSNIYIYQTNGPLGMSFWFCA